VIQMRILVGDLLDEFGLDHDSCRAPCYSQH
jgi:hypothetical protein